METQTVEGGLATADPLHWNLKAALALAQGLFLDPLLVNTGSLLVQSEVCNRAATRLGSRRRAAEGFQHSQKKRRAQYAACHHMFRRGNPKSPTLLCVE